VNGKEAGLTVHGPQFTVSSIIKSLEPGVSRSAVSLAVCHGALKDRSRCHNNIVRSRTDRCRHRPQRSSDLERTSLRHRGPWPPWGRHGNTHRTDYFAAKAFKQTLAGGLQVKRSCQLPWLPSADMKLCPGIAYERLLLPSGGAT